MIIIIPGSLAPPISMVSCSTAAPTAIGRGLARRLGDGPCRGVVVVVVAVVVAGVVVVVGGGGGGGGGGLFASRPFRCKSRMPLSDKDSVALCTGVRSSSTPAVVQPYANHRGP